MAKKVALVDVEALVSSVEDTMRTHDALPPADLKVVKRHFAVLRPRLEALGLEVTASAVRKPIERQLLGVLTAAAGFVPAKAIEKRVRGASAKETKAAVAALLADGRIVEVVRIAGPGFVLAATPRADALIPQADHVELLRRLTNAQRLVKKAAAKKGVRPALLRDDVFGPLLELAVPVAPAHDAAGVPAVTQAIRARADASDRPLRVPDLLRGLGVARDTGKRALLAGASAGHFGLEPESGMARLTAADAEWCPSGPDGTYLSWVVGRREKGAIPR